MLESTKRGVHTSMTKEIPLTQGKVALVDNEEIAAQRTYWKSLKYRDNKIVSDYDQSEWTVGEYRKNAYPVVKECEGLNCCRHIGDAMGYVECEVLAEVVVRGKVIAGEDKITAQEMKILRAWKWSKIDSVELAIYTAELVIGYYEENYPNDKRPREAIEAAKAYVKDPAYASAYAASAYAAYAASAAAYAYAAYATSAAAYASASAASAYDAASAYAASAASAYASAAYTSKEDREKAREETKTKIDKWIIARLETMEKIGCEG